MRKPCVHRWWTSHLIPSRPVCGNCDEPDVYDCFCTEDVMEKCEHYEEPKGGETNEAK